MRPLYLLLLLMLSVNTLRAQYTINCYTPLDSTIANPDRGFTMYFLSGDEYKLLLKDYPANTPVKLITRLKQQRYSLVAFIQILKEYKTKPISQGYLDTLDRNLQTLRDSGLKCMLTIYYDKTGPVYEPSLKKILADIAALKPVLRKYQDVIYVMKQGLIGPFGEEWTSSNNQFGSIMFNGEGAYADPMINQCHYADRKIILDSTLSIFTDNKMICVRQPLLRLNMFGKCYADSITEATAHSPGDWYRVGYYNDGFLASSNDLGTWHWGMPLYNGCVSWVAGVSNRVSDGAHLLKLIETETRYTVSGGESAITNQLPACAQSIARLKGSHFSFLSAEWWGPILDKWKTDGCYPEIEKNLGYRFHLDSAKYYQQMQKENSYNIKLYLSNLGYASTTYRKQVSLVFRKINDGWEYAFPLSAVDTRKWYTGTPVVIDYNVNTAVLYGGDYNIYLRIQDQSDVLRNNKDYNVRLSTVDVWDHTLKMNKINTTPCTIYWKENPGSIPGHTVRNCGGTARESNTTQKIIPAHPVTAKNYSVSVAPNPGNGQVKVVLQPLPAAKGKGIANIASVRLTDLTGKVVFHRTYGKTNTETLNITGLLPGIYVVEVGDGKNTVTAKLVVYDK